MLIIQNAQSLNFKIQLNSFKIAMDLHNHRNQEISSSINKKKKNNLYGHKEGYHVYLLLHKIS